MKLFRILKVISIVCSIIGLILASFCLMLALDSINADGMGKLGTIFIIPSVIVLVIVLFDLLITVDKIKKGLIYSCINSIIKINIIGRFIKSAINPYEYELKSNFYFYLNVIISLTIITIPSIFNIIKLIKSKKQTIETI